MLFHSQLRHYWPSMEAVEHCLPALAAWCDAWTPPGPDAVVVCHFCVYNFTLSVRRHV